MLKVIIAVAVFLGMCSSTIAGQSEAVFCQQWQMSASSMVIDVSQGYPKDALIQHHVMNQPTPNMQSNMSRLLERAYAAVARGQSPRDFAAGEYPICSSTYRMMSGMGIK